MGDHLERIFALETALSEIGGSVAAVLAATGVRDWGEGGLLGDTLLGVKDRVDDALSERSTPPPSVAAELLDVLKEAHDALGELLGTCTGSWEHLAALTGNPAWADLKARIDAACDHAEWVAGVRCSECGAATRDGNGSPLDEALCIDCGLARWEREETAAALRGHSSDAV